MKLLQYSDKTRKQSRSECLDYGWLKSNSKLYSSRKWKCQQDEVCVMPADTTCRNKYNATGGLCYDVTDHAIFS